MARLFSSIALCLLLLVGCAGHPIHPGTANKFDSDAYDALLVADSIIQTTKADLSANKFPASITPNVKSALNTLIAAYNNADAFYCGQPVTTGVGGSAALSCANGSYHYLAMSGVNTAQQNTVMQNDLNTVTTATNNLASSKVGN